MSFEPDKLFRLLPAIHRLRDANGMGTLATNPTPDALRQLLGIIADQVAVAEEELEQLYDNQFVETAAPWALPYLGELLGLRGLDAAGRDARFAPRAEVANTIAYRRRKGTAAMLEQLARDVTGHPAAAVEFWKRLATTQHVNHVRRGHAAWASVRNARQLEFVGTPFEAATRTVEVRRIERELGKWNIPNVGLFVWRLRDYTRTRSPLVESHIDDRHLRLHPLGIDVPLCARPETETDIAHLAEPKNVPLLLTWRQFAGSPVAGAANQFLPDETWYGPDRSVQLWRIAGGKWTQIPAEEIVVCDLHDVYANSVPPKIVRWGHDQTNDPLAPVAERICADKLLLDPVRGRVVLPKAEDVFATFSTLFPADLGGGEYARTASFAKSSAFGRLVAQQPLEESLPVPPDTRIQDALNAGTGTDVIIEIADSGLYVEKLPDLPANGVSIELRAEDGRWPALTLTDVWKLSGDDPGSITLNGLLITGQNLRVAGSLGALRLRHCTLLPGLNIGADGRVDSSAARPVALEVTAPGTKVELEHCILGPLRAAPDVRVRMRNCIVDAGDPGAWAVSGPDSTAGRPGGGAAMDAPRLQIERVGAQIRISWTSAVDGFQLQALDLLAGGSWVAVPRAPVVNGTRYTVTLALDGGSRFFRLVSRPDSTASTPGGMWRIENCTIIGRIAARGLELASNTIFHGESVAVERRQEGCVRFCWLPDDSVVPRQHKCVPRVEQDEKGKDIPVDFRPQFMSLRFGDAAYCQLSRSCADAIRRGADDESEMGVYHDLLEPRREAHLRARLRDYLRFGLEAGVFYEQQTPRVSAT